MTPERRNEIISKEALTIVDMAELLDCSSNTARRKMIEVKLQKDRLKISGILHIQDYIDYYGLDITRFAMPKKYRPYEDAYEGAVK